MKHTLSLSRWHKVVERLNAHAKTLSAAVRSAYVDTNIQSFLGDEQVAQLNEVAEKADKSLNQFLEITKVISVVRSTLGKQNVEHGVNALVAEQEHLSRDISLLKQLLDGQSMDMVAVDKLESNKALSDTTANRYGYSAVKVRLLPKERKTELEVLLAESQSRVHALSDELSDINKVTVSIEVPNDISKIAGLV